MELSQSQKQQQQSFPVNLSSNSIGFPSQPDHYGPLYSSLTITNPQQIPHVFKIKTTNNSIFMITPFQGEIQPNQSVTLSIKMSPLEKFSSYLLLQDKFLVTIDNLHVQKIKLYVYQGESQEHLVDLQENKHEDLFKKFAQTERALKKVKEERDLFWQSSNNPQDSQKGSWWGSIIMVFLIISMRVSNQKYEFYDQLPYSLTQIKPNVSQSKFADDMVIEKSIDQKKKKKEKKSSKNKGDRKCQE